jgi:hypothetical protein
VAQGGAASDVQRQSLGLVFLPVENVRVSLRGGLTNATNGDKTLNLNVFTAL